jgi:hypothetical protein
LFRPVPGLRLDRRAPSADALGYYLSPYGLNRLEIVAAREGMDGWQYQHHHSDPEKHQRVHQSRSAQRAHQQTEHCPSADESDARVAARIAQQQSAQ